MRAFSTVKIALLRPIPNDSDTTTAITKPGRLRNVRAA